MEIFEPKQLVSNEINNGEKYRNKVDSPQADAFNKLVEAILYAQQNGVKITLDTELSSTSENAVQNKVITEALEGKLTVIKGDSAPTKETFGELGQFYTDNSTGISYQCTAITDGVYTWQQIVVLPKNDATVGAVIITKSRNGGLGTQQLVQAMPATGGWGVVGYHNGKIYSQPPEDDRELANLGYIKENFARKLVTHNITIKCSEGITDSANEFELRATLTSKRHDVYRSIEELEGIVAENAEAWDLRGYWNEETMQYEPELRGTYENVTIETRIETADFDENRKIAYLILRDASGNAVLEVGSPDMFDAPSFYIASDIVE